MRKILITLFLIGSFVACNSDDGPPTEYFVKYKASTPDIPYRSIPVDIMVQTPDGKEAFSTLSGQDFEMTYGPVLKGFEAKMEIRQHGNREIMVIGEIQTSTENTPFTLMAVENKEAMGLVIEHTIE